MIIQTTGTDLILITQPDHAALAGALMTMWQADGLPESPRRQAILLAAAHHDDGWRQEDASPLVDESTGALLDFVHAPDIVRQRVWPVAIHHLADTPYAAALVAEHAVSVYERYRASTAWHPFFASIEAARDYHLQHAAPLTLADLEADYSFVRMGDQASLIVCNDWRDVHQQGRYRISYDGRDLTIVPDPFEGRRVRLAVRARRLGRRPFSDGHEAVEAYRLAPDEALSFTAGGPHP